MLSSSDHVDLEELVGTKLTAVTFVQDYVQLHFADVRINAITQPTVVAESAVHWGEDGYRDRLCEQLGARVEAALVRAGDCLTISFQNGTKLVVRLDVHRGHSEEAATYENTRTGAWEVW